MPAQLPHVDHPTAPIPLACGGETLPWTPVASLRLISSRPRRPSFQRYCFALLPKLIKSNLIVPACRALDALVLPCQLMSGAGLSAPAPEP